MPDDQDSETLENWAGALNLGLTLLFTDIVDSTKIGIKRAFLSPEAERRILIGPSQSNSPSSSGSTISCATNSLQVFITSSLASIDIKALLTAPCSFFNSGNVNSNIAKSRQSVPAFGWPRLAWYEMTFCAMRSGGDVTSTSSIRSACGSDSTARKSTRWRFRGF